MSAKYDISRVLLEIQEKEIFKINEAFLLFGLSEDMLSKTDLNLIEVAARVFTLIPQVIFIQYKNFSLKI